MAKNTDEYGTTWWGTRWLDALKGIDYANRIPRGFSYASQGKVFSVIMDPAKGCVKARVKGQCDPFYSVKIEFPRFSGDEKEELLREIANSPVILAKLSSRELAPEIDSLADGLGIHVFPRKWSDLHTTCSCPDHAVPCKHIAAVIYKLSQEIDANPFVFFDMRGFDIVSELARLNVNFEQAEQSEMPTWRQLLEEKGRVLQPLTAEELKKATFREIPELLDSVTGLFKPSPAGYVHGDLRDRMRKCLAKAMRLADQQMRDRTDRDLPEWGSEGPALAFDSWGQARPGPDLSWRIHSAANSGEPVTVRPFSPADGKCLEGAGFHEMFSGSMDQRLLETAPVETELLYHAWFAATKLVRQGAVIPQIYEPVDDLFTVRWIPAVMDPGVRELTDAVGAAFLRVPDTVVKIDRRPEVMNPRVLGEMILSFFIGSYVVKAFIALTHYEGESLPPEMSSLFLGQMVDTQELLAGNSVRMGMESWIAPIYLQDLQVQPVIILEDRSFCQLENVVKAVRSGEDSGSFYVDFDALEEETEPGEGISLAPVTDDDEAARENDPGETGSGAGSGKTGDAPRKGLFDNDTGVGISMGFNRLDITGTPEDVFIPLADIIEKPEYGKIKFECLRTTSRLSAVCPALTELLETRGGEGTIALKDMAEMILSTIPAMKLLGVRLIVPRSLRKVIYPRSSMTLSLKNSWDEGSGCLGLEELMRFRWDIALGDHNITAEEFAELRRHEGKVVRFGSSFVYVDPSLTSRIAKKLMLSQGAPSKQRLMAAALTGRFGEDNVRITRELKDALSRLLSEDSTALPGSLRADLRPYQIRGYSWLIRNLRTMMGSILADDMGLGKTLQVIAALEKLRADGELDQRQALVVVPTSLVINWQKEVARFAPELTCNVFYKERDLGIPAHLIITTYGVLRSDIALFRKKNFRLVIIDEAQNIKNHKSKVFHAVRSVKADSMIALSGTPVENRLMEYWSIMDFTNPGLLGTPELFQREYANPIEKNRDPEAVRSFRRVTAPFIMRRLKTDKSVISDLPDKIVVDKYCSLTPVQAALYEAKVQQTMQAMKTVKGEMRCAMVLSLIQDLKQICNAPSHFSQEDPHQGPDFSGKMEVLFELLEEMRENSRQCLIFTQFRVMGDLLQSWIEERTGFKPQFIHGGVPADQRAAMVERFQNRREERCMILSLKAAGTGLTLTAASAVIHFDLWWNPAVEDQATDRAYRIGQTQNVQVYRLICANTFEEKINEIIRSKKDLADVAVNVGESWIGDLSNRQIEEIFTLSTEAAMEERAARERQGEQTPPADSAPEMEAENVAAE